MKDTRNSNRQRKAASSTERMNSSLPTVASELIYGSTLVAFLVAVASL